MAFIAYIWKFHTLTCWVNYASIKLCLLLWEGCFHPPKEYLRQYVSSRSTSALQLSQWHYGNSPHSDMRSSVSWAHLVIVMRKALYGSHYCSVSVLNFPELSRKTLHRLPWRRTGASLPSIPWFCWISNLTSVHQQSSLVGHSRFYHVK